MFATVIFFFDSLLLEHSLYSIGFSHRRQHYYNHIELRLKKKYQKVRLFTKSLQKKTISQNNPRSVMTLNKTVTKSCAAELMVDNQV